ncbi:MAG: hypothetical protein FWE10_08765 [Rikenellaceae bacterium]|nr:hypothetical protein [Rikenellaceae bacterium]
MELQTEAHDDCSPAGRFSHLFAKIARHAVAPRGGSLLAMLVRSRRRRRANTQA